MPSTAFSPSFFPSMRALMCAAVLATQVACSAEPAKDTDAAVPAEAPKAAQVEKQTPSVKDVLVKIATKRDITIMPLGDSITAGPLSYRAKLLKLLKDADYGVQYEGSQAGGNPNYPELGNLDHEGYGGKTIQFLVEHIKEVYPVYGSDIVLLHAGHNQFADQGPVPGVVESTRQIIEYVRSVNPNVVVMLAQVIPSGKLPKYSYIPELNEELGKLAAEMDTPAQRVAIVNMAEGWDWRADTTDDLVHPTREGGEKMAQKWFGALVKVLPTPR